MEAALWESANKLRGAVEPAEYKHVVLSLIFLKYASDKFEERRQEIIAEGHEAFVDNVAFRLMKNNTPGNYTFILKGTKEVPRRLLQEKRKTIGMRVPSNPIAQALLEALGEPMLSTSLMLPGSEFTESDPEEIKDRLEKQVDLIIHGGYLGQKPTTVIDLTDDTPVVLREGVGDVKPFL